MSYHWHPDPSPQLDAGSLGRMMGLFHPFQPKEGDGSLTASACRSMKLVKRGGITWLSFRSF